MQAGKFGHGVSQSLVYVPLEGEASLRRTFVEN